MEPVVTVNLNGNPYQLDQSAYDALKAYLDHAGATLGANPDKAEIIRDLEQAIADKCAAYLSPHKTVISADEIARALGEMGPVESGDGASEHRSESAQTGSAKKRMYRIRDDAKVAGVCSGLAAYFDLDVNLIRLLFIVMAVITSGGFILVYVVLMFLIPSAHTSEEWAAAHGVPFNAQEVIDKAKRQYSDFSAHGPPWSWRRDQRRAWRRQMRDRFHGWDHSWSAPPPPRGPVSYAGRVFGGLFAIVFGVLRVVLAIVFFTLVITLLTTGHLGYWYLPDHMQAWQGVFILIALYVLIAIPLRALRWAAYGAYGGRPYGGEGLALLAVFALAGWFAYQYIPEAHAWMDQANLAVQHFVADMRRDLD